MIVDAVTAVKVFELLQGCPGGYQLAVDASQMHTLTTENAGKQQLVLCMWSGNGSNVFWYKVGQSLMYQTCRRTMTLASCSISDRVFCVWGGISFLYWSAAKSVKHRKMQVACVMCRAQSSACPAESAAVSRLRTQL